MGVTKEIIKTGDGVTYPQLGQLVSVHYTGWLNERGGKKFDTSVGRGQR